MTCVLDAPLSSDADPRSSTQHTERRLKSVALGCYGNGRRLDPPRNNKWPRKIENEVFVPSQALADIMKTMPEVRRSAALTLHSRVGEVRGEGMDTTPRLTFVFACGFLFVLSFR